VLPFAGSPEWGRGAVCVRWANPDVQHPWRIVQCPSSPQHWGWVQQRWPVSGNAHRCNKIAEAEAAVSVNEKKWLVMHVQLKLDELRGPPNPWLTVT
jgi:hypothetical protein